MLSALLTLRARRHMTACSFVGRISSHSIGGMAVLAGRLRSEEHTSELQSLMRISYAVFCLKKNIASKSVTWCPICRNITETWMVASAEIGHAQLYTPVTHTPIQCHHTMPNNKI